MGAASSSLQADVAGVQDQNAEDEIEDDKQNNNSGGSVHGPSDTSADSV